MPTFYEDGLVFWYIFCFKKEIMYFRFENVFKPITAFVVRMKRFSRNGIIHKIFVSVFNQSGISTTTNFVGNEKIV